jgi:predicted phage terminase large subunit-like protein
VIPGTRNVDELEHGLCLRSFAHFVRRAWRECDPAPLVWGWHMQAMCAHLQAVAEGRIQRLIINVPPGHAKSMLVSVLWPAWIWARRPQWSALFASYEMGLSMRDAVKCRDLMRGDWYTRWFRSAESPFTCCTEWEFADAQDQKSFFKNTQGGIHAALSVGGRGTGYRGDCLVIDDPISASGANSQHTREDVVRWKTEVMSSRFNDAVTAAQVLIMQRLHEQDLTGYLLQQGGWQHLCLPSEFDPQRRSVTYDTAGKEFWRDPRSEAGELLFPEKFSREVLDDLRSGRGMGSYAFAGQHQQQPVPSSGGLLKREWFSPRWAHSPSGAERPLPPKFDRVTMFVDASFKDSATSDLVAIGVFGSLGADQYMLKLAWERLAFTGTVWMIQKLRDEYNVRGVYIEDRANGSAIIDTLKGKIPGIVPMEPLGGKESRIAAASVFIEAGNLILPAHATWLNDYISEACAFPRAAHDDAIDMTAYALNTLCTSNKARAFAAMGAL